MKVRKIKTLWIPLLMVAAALLGLLIGHICGRNSAMKKGMGLIEAASQQMNIMGQCGKMQDVLNMVNKFYVEDVDADSLQDVAIPLFLKQLDPHTIYVPRNEVQRVTGELKSNFGGVGITFTILHDTVRVQSVVSGGPSSALGVQGGDKIIKVNGHDFTGPNLTNQMVMDSLRGEMGTKVQITVLRRGGKTIDFDITRGEIPLTSVLTSFQIAKGVGYMKIDRFAEKTYEEMINGIAKLRSQGCRHLIVDLRGNTGGFLGVVSQMCNEFLERNEMIVYTEGKHQKRQEMRADGTGSCRDMGLTVLIDEASASASEIFAGAMQDNDRGTVIGRRSFGKGLVQNEMYLADGSIIRLTVARYHTPSGRCIQRPYDQGQEEYYEDAINRYRNGELVNADSIKTDTTQIFYTRCGRKVYGGGGIVPDVFVPYDTTSASRYLIELRAQRIIYDWATNYVDAHRAELSQMSTEEFIHHLLKLQCLQEVRDFAKKQGVVCNGTLDSKEAKVIENEARAYIGNAADGYDVLYPVLLTQDDAVGKALEMLDVKPLYR